MYLKRVLVILVLAITLFGIVQGSCLEYGHSCWGAHGKRSGKTEITSMDRSENNELDNNIKETELRNSKNSNKFILSILLDKTFVDQLADTDVQDPSGIKFDDNDDEVINKNKFKTELRKRRVMKNSHPNRDFFIRPQIIGLDNDLMQNDNLKKYAGLLPFFKTNGDFYQTKSLDLAKSGPFNSLDGQDVDVN